jgi:formylglycine-generating enzyme required for sulfatase activity
MAFNWIPPGTFWMGSPEEEPGRYENEEPRHRVTLTRPFYFGVYPMTLQQHQELLGVLGPDEALLGSRADHPICDISWEAAQEVCLWLSQLPAEQAAGRHYRLPTEAEWEYACRAGTSTPFSFGATLSAEEANFNSVEPYGRVQPTPAVGTTTRVGSYPPNAFGLYDLHGNVQEWCRDWYGPYPAEDQTDPTGPEQGDQCVLRGGSWLVDGTRCRSARRNHFDPDSHNTNYGLRVVLELTPSR